MQNKKLVMIVGAVVVAGAIGFAAYRGYLPPSSGTEGAIGAANRYTSQQMTEQDVTLKSPEVQSFLQSDTFHKLATDANFRSLVTEQAFTDALNNRSFSDLLHTDAGRELIMSDAAHAVIGDGLIQKMSAEQVRVTFASELAHLMSDERFVRMAGTDAFQADAAKGWTDAAMTKTADFKSFIDDPNWATIKNNPDFAHIVADGSFKTLVDNANFVGVMEQIRKTNATDFASAISDEAVRRMAALDQFRSLDMALLADALKMPAFDMLAQKGELARLVDDEARRTP